LSASPDPPVDYRTSRQFREILQSTAGSLGVDEAFIEKDWHVVQLLKGLAKFRYNDCRLVFGGGTSLSKAFGLIRRFSEDIDFRVVPGDHVSALSDGQRRRFRNAVEDEIARSGYLVDGSRTESRNSRRMFTLFVPYDPIHSNAALRPDIKVEVSLEAPRLETAPRGVLSFMTQAHSRHRIVKQPPVTIDCIDPVETAADKLAALSWRVFEQRTLPDTAGPSGRARDRSLVRHVHDLCALEQTVATDPRFKPLLSELLDHDNVRRGAETRDERPSDPEERIGQICETLLNKPFLEDYRKFVREVGYGNPIPSIEEGVAAIARLASCLSAEEVSILG
jgi:hypothetical protein